MGMSMRERISSNRAWRWARRVAASDRTSGLIMIAFAFAGLLAANLPSTYHLFEAVAETHVAIPWLGLDMPIGHWAQDGLLTIFFLVVGLDLKQELTTGSLANPRAAAVPMLAAVGGMLVPPIIFLIVMGLFSQFGPPYPGVVFDAEGGIHTFAQMAHGWAIPTATDIAFSLAVLALFAKGLPGTIRAFLMTLATVDDLLGIIVIAVFFSSLNAWYWFVGLAVCAVMWMMLVRLERVPWPLAMVVGLAAWFMMYQVGVHPTLAGVLVGLLTPSREVHGEHTPRAERYAEKLQPFSALLALPVFAFFATGIHFDRISPGMLLSPVFLGLMLALVVGKPLGIMAVSALVTKVCGLRLAHGLRLRDLFPMSCACGIGFTVSFLIASLAYKQEVLSGEARLAVLVGSLMAAAISGVLLHRQARMYRAKRVQAALAEADVADEPTVAIPVRGAVGQSAGSASANAASAD